ncbi:hypothetical protein ACFW9U_26680 [Rhodococcus aetherivorans]|uniref:hypothetical protein n=1 Tax=Rhodococcus aetherivorans TaxID=191292 RepID=UPI00366D3189
MNITTFDPPAYLDDFTPEERAAWSDWISDRIDASATEGDGTVREQWFNPLNVDLAADAAIKDITWTAFPKSVLLRFQGAPARFAAADRTRDVQDEYCEWSVERDITGKIKRVTFTSEGPEYWQFLAESSPDKVLALYRQHVSPSVRQEDIFTANGQYIRRNKWNNSTTEGAMHLIQPANTLGAEIELGAAATVPRGKNGALLTTEQELIVCSRYGVATRNSDPHIGGEVNALTRAGAFVTLQNPVGLYIQGLSTAGWKTPDGADPQDFWTITRGDSVHAVRAVYEVLGHHYLVGDIRILGKPIEWGSQIADYITIRLTGLAHKFGSAPPTLHDCLGDSGGAPAPLTVAGTLAPRNVSRA